MVSWEIETDGEYCYQLKHVHSARRMEVRWSLVRSSTKFTFALIGGADIVEDEALIFRRLPDPQCINTEQC